MYVEGVFHSARLSAQENHVERGVPPRRDHLGGRRPEFIGTDPSRYLVVKEGAVEVYRVAGYGEHLYARVTVDVVNRHFP